MAEFRMPSLGADMDAGVLLEWLVRPGDAVRKGDIVAVVDTSKAAIEIECFDSGVVQELLVEPGTRVPVGAPLAIIAGKGEPAARAPVPAAAPVGIAAAARVAGPAAAPATVFPVTSPLVRRLAAERGVDLAAARGTGPGGRITHADVEREATARQAVVATKLPPATMPRRVKASPLARRLAVDVGVDLSTVTGTGRDGAISADDVRLAARTAAPAPDEQERRRENMRAAIAALMARSKREIPHYYLTETIDLSRAMGWLRERNRALPVPGRLVPAVLLLKAAARAARAVPQLNGFWHDNRFVPGAGVHLGVAIALRGGGLVAPAIHDADERDLSDLMAALRDLVDRTRAGRLRSAEMSEPTITVSNLGDQGVESILGIIYPPQVALVGFGRVMDRPWALDGLLGIRPTVTASLAGDHRATDGATGARYLQSVAQLLQTPEEL
jgi:pyruvate dehydrogenase E2 component (dihydrolipoamide acetyltransferase)